MHYFDKVKQDYASLGLSDNFYPKIKTYGSAYLIAKCTQNILPGMENPDYVPLTELGSNIAAAKAANIRFTGILPYTILKVVKTPKLL